MIIGPSSTNYTCGRVRSVTILLGAGAYRSPIRATDSHPPLLMSTRRFAPLTIDLLSRQEDGSAPQAPQHGSPVVAFIIGLAIVLLASVLNAAGLNLTKLDHVRCFQTLAPATVPPNGVGSTLELGTN